MNISENKRASVLSAVFALAFCGVMYYGYEASTNAKEAKAELVEIDENFQDYNSAKFVPNAGNIKNLKAASAQFTQLGKDLQKQLDAYRSASATNSLTTSPVQFQNDLRQAIAALKERSTNEKVTLGAQASTLGMGIYQNQTPVKNEVFFRAFMLGVADHTTNLLIDSKVPSIDKVYCTKLPAEAAADLKKAPSYFPMDVELSFNVKRGNLPEILNKLMSDKRYFFTITGVAAQTLTKPAVLDAYKKMEEPVEMAGELILDEEGEIIEEEEVGHVIAVRKFGLDDELVHVHLNLQVLFFNPVPDAK